MNLHFVHIQDQDAIKTRASHYYRSLDSAKKRTEENNARAQALGIKARYTHTTMNVQPTPQPTEIRD